jgi:hypothetical protein
MYDINLPTRGGLIWSVSAMQYATAQFTRATSGHNTRILHDEKVISDPLISSCISVILEIGFRPAILI